MSDYVPNESKEQIKEFRSITVLKEYFVIRHMEGEVDGLTIQEEIDLMIKTKDCNDLPKGLMKPEDIRSLEDYITFCYESFHHDSKVFYYNFLIIDLITGKVIFKEWSEPDL